MDEKRKPIRWWPALLVILGAIAGLFFVWILQEDRPMQTKFMRTMMIGMGSFVLLLIWLLLFSRVRWKWRLSLLGLILGAAALSALSLEIRGVTGDLLPIVEFRWRAKHSIPAASVASVTTNSWKQVPGEFPGLYGPERNATIRNVTLETNWSQYPPKVLWKIQVGQAWSGFAVWNGLAVTQEQREESEYVVCYEVLTGRVVWTHADQAKYSTTIAGEGPRATPTISSNRVYTFGATGILNCLDLQTGRSIWRKDTLKEHDATIGDWGLASSPLVFNGKVIVSVGGRNGRSLVAHDAVSGDFLWGAGQASADYSSPIAANLLGTEQVIIFNGYGLVSHSLNGSILWDYSWPGGHPHITPPLVISSNLVFASSGYGTGAELLNIEQTQGKWKAVRVWKSLAIKSKFGPLLREGGHIYGLDDGMMTCLDWKTGKRQWKDGRYGHGQGLLVGGQILFTTEKGELLLIQPDPSALVELARVPLFSDKTWNPPSLAGEYLLARNHKEAACVQLTLRQPALAQTFAF